MKYCLEWCVVNILVLTLHMLHPKYFKVLIYTVLIYNTKTTLTFQQSLMELAWNQTFVEIHQTKWI